MTRVRQLCNQWCDKNKQFFKHRNIIEEKYLEAQQSLLNYLLINKVATDEIEMFNDYVGFRWEYGALIIPMVIDWSISSLFDLGNNEMILCRIGLCILAVVIGWVIHREAKKLVLSEAGFCKQCAIKYKEIYGNDMDRAKKLERTKFGSYMSIPVNAHRIYDSNLHNSDHYANVLKISIADDGSVIEYFWYTNKNYKSINQNSRDQFIKACNKQIGVDWSNVDIDNFCLEQLQPHNEL